MEITYERAMVDDIAPLFNLCKQLILDYEQLENIDLPKVLQWVERKIQTSIQEYTAIYASGQKAGYYHFFQHQDGQFELDDLYVFEEFQNQGIGTKVIQKCCTDANAPVMLYVFIQNKRAVSLYQRLGFTITETTHNTRYIMVKEPAAF